MADTVRFIFASDFHVPLQSELTIEKLLKEIKEFKPNVLILGGDLLEADAASRFQTEPDWELANEYQEGNKILRRIRSACSSNYNLTIPSERISAGKCSLVFMNGNHENNLISKGRISKAVRSLCDFNLHIDELKYWKQFPYHYSKAGVFRLGQISMAHGYEAGVSSDEMQGYVLGMPYGLFISGHTHRPLQVTQGMRTKTIPLPYWYCNSGLCADPNAFEYMERRKKILWGNAYVKGEVVLLKSPRHNRNWSAETVIVRGYDYFS